MSQVQKYLFYGVGALLVFNFIKKQNQDYKQEEEAYRIGMRESEDSQRRAYEFMRMLLKTTTNDLLTYKY